MSIHWPIGSAIPEGHASQRTNDIVRRSMEARLWQGAERTTQMTFVWPMQKSVPPMQMVLFADADGAFRENADCLLPFHAIRAQTARAGRACLTEPRRGMLARRDC